MLLGGVLDTPVLTTQLFPWTSMRIADAQTQGTVQGGLCMSNTYIKPGMPEVLRSFDECIMIPGSVMVLALTCGLDSASATTNIDISVQWQES